MFEACKLVVCIFKELLKVYFVHAKTQEVGERMANMAYIKLALQMTGTTLHNGVSTRNCIDNSIRNVERSLKLEGEESSEKRGEDNADNDGKYTSKDERQDGIDVQ